MIKTTDYISCYENILDKDFCKDLIESSTKQNFHRADTFNNSNAVDKFRNCYSRKIENPEIDKVFFDAVGNVLKKYVEQNKHFNTGLTTEDTGYTHLLYVGSQKGEYKEHTDSADIVPRVLTISFILNEDYDGGDFVFFGGQYVVKKKTASAVVFPSNFCFPHAVTPVTNGNRHAVITWIH